MTSRFAGGGRWSLVSARIGKEAAPTERALARAQLLLDRYGVVSREAAAAEEVPGGFAALSPVFRMLEESGRVRRGYFASGLDGRQFAAPAAIDRLRAPASGDDAVILAAADPANPYGAILPWPEGRSGFSRRSGAVVVLWRGHLAWYWEAGGKSLVAGSELSADELAEAMRSAAPAVARVYRRRALRVETVDGEPARTSSMASLLLDCGFRSELRGLGYEAGVG
jgi:ATP-dependent Lhr-like helicase